MFEVDGVWGSACRLSESLPFNVCLWVNRPMKPNQSRSLTRGNDLPACVCVKKKHSTHTLWYIEFLIGCAFVFTDRMQSRKYSAMCYVFPLFLLVEVVLIYVDSDIKHSLCLSLAHTHTHCFSLMY